MQNEENKMEKIVSLAKQRGFIYPGSEIYGGLQNSWDFGPLGAELKKNIKDEWWKRFVRNREDMVGVDTALIMNPKVWEASGHLGSGFADPLVECKKCHERFRADHIDLSAPCQNCGESKSFTEPKSFNILMKTFLGAIEGEKSEAYLRGETAQGMFVNFKNIIDSTRKKLPFGVAQIGKSFRNEITPGNYIFRTREFEQMEIEYFIPRPASDADWERYFEEWRIGMHEWMTGLGIKPDEIHELDVPKEDLAHYSKKTIDFEYDFPFGRKELYGLAYRTDFDLKNHGEKSGANLKYRDSQTGEEYYPHVIEPTFGVERTALAAMCSAYTEEDAPIADNEGTDKRVVMKFPKWLAPVKAAALPLSKKSELSELAKKIADDLRRDFMVEYDDTQSIGRRYRRQDEIGTPYCVTVDFDSLKDDKATVRDRDTMGQERINLGLIREYIRNKLTGVN